MLFAFAVDTETQVTTVAGGEVGALRTRFTTETARRRRLRRGDLLTLAGNTGANVATVIAAQGIAFGAVLAFIWSKALRWWQSCFDLDTRAFVTNAHVAAIGCTETFTLVAALALRREAARRWIIVTDCNA